MGQANLLFCPVLYAPCPMPLDDGRSPSDGNETVLAQSVMTSDCHSD